MPMEDILWSNTHNYFLWVPKLDIVWIDHIIYGIPRGMCDKIRPLM